MIHFLSGGRNVFHFHLCVSTHDHVSPSLSPPGSGLCSFTRALVGRRLLPKSARQLSKRFYRGKPLLPQMSVISSARWPWLLHQTSSSSEFLACVMCAPPLWTAWRHSLIMLIDLRVSLWEGYGPGSRPQQMIMYGGRWAGSGGSLRRRTAAMLPQAAGGGCAPVAGSGSGRRAARGVGQPVG